MHIEVESIPPEGLSAKGEEETSAMIRARVSRARQVQLDRYKNDPAGIRINAQLSARNINEACEMTPDAKKILLVEDEKAIRDAVAAYLEREGYWVVGVGDGQSAIEEFEKHQFDLVVLDLMLPKIPGERVCRTIRDTSDVPIILLTAKGEIEDRIIGLELGADDYLIKPFSPRELVARVRALFRRAHQADEPAVEVLDFGDLVIDISGHKILVEGKEVDLTASEFKLLTTLARHPGRDRKSVV